MDFTFDHNGREAVQAIDRFGQDQAPFAIAKALTETAKFAQRVAQEEMSRDFDRPTAFTQNSLFVKSATKTKHIAELAVRTYKATKSRSAVAWLGPQLAGGPRGLKGFESKLRRAGVLGPSEYAMPGEAAKLDEFGNMSRGQLVAILSDVQAWRASDTVANSTAKTRKRRGNRTRLKGKAIHGGVYFVVPTPRGKLRPGIYERAKFAFGSAVRPVLIFTRVQPTYEKRWRFQEAAQRVMDDRYALELKWAIEEALATAVDKRVAA